MTQTNKEDAARLNLAAHRFKSQLLRVLSLRDPDQTRRVLQLCRVLIDAGNHQEVGGSSLEAVRLFQEDFNTYCQSYLGRRDRTAGIELPLDMEEGVRSLFTACSDQVKLQRVQRLCKEARQLTSSISEEGGVIQYTALLKAWCSDELSGCRMRAQERDTGFSHQAPPRPLRSTAKQLRSPEPNLRAVSTTSSQPN